MRTPKIILAELDVNFDSILKGQKELETKLGSLMVAREKLIAADKTHTEEYKNLNAAINVAKQQYDDLSEVVNEQLTLNTKYIAQQQLLENQVAYINESETEYIENNKELIKQKKELNVNDANYKQNLELINAKIQENNKWLKENGSEHARLITTMNDYKQQVAESFDSINIFNGGLSGLISRAQEAGGVGPLVQGAFEGMSQGIVGMTKSAMSFIATPIGAILAAIALVIALVQNSMERGTESAGKITKIFTTFSVITDKLMGLLEPLGDFLIDGIAAGFEMAGKAADAAMGFISDGLAFLGFDDAAQGVKDFTEDVKNTAAETTNLKNAQEKLAAQMAVQEVNNEKAKQQIDALIKKSEDQTASEEDRLAALTEAATIEKNNLEERKKLADEAYNQEVRKAALNKGLTKEEVAALQEGGAAYAEKMMKVKGFTQEEIDALQKGQTERMRLSGEETQMLQDQEAARQKVRDDAAAKRKAAEEERRKKAQDALNNEVTRQKLELDLYIENQGKKAKSLQEELTQAETVAKKKMDLAQAEFNASKKTANDSIALQLANAQTQNDLAQARANAAVDNAGRELQAYIQKSNEQAVHGKFLSEELLKQETDRLDAIEKKEIEFQAKRLANGAISEQEYIDEITRIKDANQVKQDGLLMDREEAEKAKQALDLENKRAADTENHDYDLKYQLDSINAQRAQELAEAEKTGADKSLINAKYDKQEVDAKRTVMDNKLSLANQTLGSLSTILGKESAAGKAVAVAQATIDTYKAAVSAYASMSVIPIVGPAMGAVAAAAAVAAGIANVKKITSTREAKPPKAAKGALFNIGGNRHSNGGTMFTGADGTRFEAEQGELIGVMNRNAAAHFMAFNNAFPAGGSSAPNYFANGGIVSREIASPGLNTDELAAKIAAANASIPAPVVSVQDIITQGNSYVQVRDGANF